MNKYMSPEINIEEFDTVDVIRTSGEGPMTLDAQGSMLKSVNSSDIERNVFE